MIFYRYWEDHASKGLEIYSVSRINLGWFEKVSRIMKVILYRNWEDHASKGLEIYSEFIGIVSLNLRWFERVFRTLKSNFLSKMRGSCLQRIGKISRVSWINLDWFEKVSRILKSDFLSKIGALCFQRIGDLLRVCWNNLGWLEKVSMIWEGFQDLEKWFFIENERIVPPKDWEDIQSFLD